MKPKCPHCGRTLLDDQADRCVYCKSDLPADLCLDNPAKLCCPHCGRQVQNRLVDRCMYCQGAFPEEMCLSVEEKGLLQAEIEAMREDEKRKLFDRSIGPVEEIDIGDDERYSERFDHELLSSLPWTKYLIPQYNELCLYLISVAFLLSGWRPLLSSITSSKGLHVGLYYLVCQFLPLFIVFILGLILSIVTILTPRIPSQQEKKIMLFFAIIANAVAGIACSAYLMQPFNLQADTWAFMLILCILPAWNILSSVYTLVLWHFKIIDEEAISDEQVAVSHFLKANAILFATLLICHYVFHCYWAITFSVSVTYANMVRKEPVAEAASMPIQGD